MSDSKKRFAGKFATVATATVKSLGHSLGVEVGHYRPVEQRRAQIIIEHNVDLVLDVGANVGQYAQSIRAHGYGGRIISFEPLLQAYGALEVATLSDPHWKAHRVAFSDIGGSADLHVGQQDTTSSLLDMALDRDAFPAGKQERTETVPVARLDDFELEFGCNTLLKLDVQGAELRVLKGGTGSLRRLTLIECELSIVELYSQQPLITDALEFLRDQGFELIALEPGFYDPASGKQLQFDGIFRRGGGDPSR
jgi:FkbM family methyltransferase